MAVAISPCSGFPRNARLIMASVMIGLLFIIRSKHFLQKVVSVAIACSWTRSMLRIAFHRPNAILASRCDWVFSCDLIFTPKFFGLPDTVGPLFMHCRSITEQPTSLTMWLLRRWREAEPLPFYFYCPIMCMVVFFRESASVAILTADSKRFIWAAWT